MKIYRMSFPHTDHSPVLFMGMDDGRINLEQLRTAIMIETECHNDETVEILATADQDGMVNIHPTSVICFTSALDEGGTYKGWVEFSDVIPCYGLPEDQNAVKHFLPTMIPQHIQNEVLIQWKSRAMSQGYPIPEKDGTFGKPTKSNLEAAERELCFFFGAVACYDALTDALKTKETSAPPVWVFPVMQGHSIAWSMEHNL